MTNLEKIRNVIREKKVVFFYVSLFILMIFAYYLNEKKLSMFGNLALFDVAGLAFRVFILIQLAILFFLWKRYFLKQKKEKSFLIFSIDRRYYLAAGVIAFCVFYGIHGFSIVSWSRFIANPEHNNVLWGFRRDITTDVWALAIPSIFSQIHNGFPIYNYDMMLEGANSIIMSLPALELTLISKPFLWGYVLFGKSGGLAWHYTLKLSLMFLSSYEIFYFLTEKRPKRALTFSLLLTFSSAIQWWIGQSIMDVIINFQVCIAGLILYTSSKRNFTDRIVFFFTATVFGSGFLLGLYPPFQVPLGYAGLIIIGYILFGNNREYRFKKRDAFLFSLIIIVLMGIIGKYFKVCGVELNRIINTLYPGHRVAYGGDLPSSIWYYQFYQWLLPFKSAPISNNCELSWVNPIVFLFLFSFPLTKIKASKWIWGLYGYTMFLVTWVFIPLPKIIGKISLFSYVTEQRLMIIVGILSFYLMAVVFSKDKLFEKNKVWILVMSVGLSTAFSIDIFRNKTEFLRGSNFTILIFALISILMVWISCIVYFRGETKKILIMLLIFSMNGLLINPICLGISPMYSSELSHKIFQIEKRDSNQLWAINEPFPYNNYLIAHGVKSVNGLNSYPDLKKWNTIDPNGLYEKIYNRYAHISVSIDEDESKVELLAPDSILIHLDWNMLKEMKVKYVLSRKEISKKKFSKLFSDNLNKFSIYEVIYD